MKRILFVDDDASVLSGLKGVLFRDRKRWDMSFAFGPLEAFEELAATAFDAVVTDMRMPEVDGAALIEHVRATSPATRRMILSGSVDEADLVRAAAAADEVVAKPCNASTLREALERLLA
jgi:CheY-like chemotaxis protein